MKRREFITLLGGAAAWPRAAIAQTSSKVYRVGLLSALAPPSDTSPFIAPLIRSLDKFGYVLGRNLVFERRGAEGNLIAYHSLSRNWSRARLMLPWSPGFRRRLHCDKRRAFRQCPIWPSTIFR
jgi:hypothetical protein